MSLAQMSKTPEAARLRGSCQNPPDTTSGISKVEEGLLLLAKLLGLGLLLLGLLDRNGVLLIALEGVELDALALFLFSHRNHLSLLP